MQVMHTSISHFEDKLFLGISLIYFLLQVRKRFIPLWKRLLCFDSAVTCYLDYFNLISFCVTVQVEPR